MKSIYFGCIVLLLITMTSMKSNAQNIATANISWDADRIFNATIVPDKIEFAVLKNIYESLGGSGWTNKTNWPANNNTNPDGANKYIESQYTVNVHGEGMSSEEKIIAWKVNSSSSLESEPAVTSTISTTILEV